VFIWRNLVPKNRFIIYPGNDQVFSIEDCIAEIPSGAQRGTLRERLRCAASESSRFSI